MSREKLTQATARQRPSIRTIIRQYIESEQGADAAFEAIRAAYEELSDEQIYSAIRAEARRFFDEVERNLQEAQDVQRLQRLIGPVFADGRAETVGEALLILAGEGNPEAQALVEQLCIGGPNDGDPAPPEA